MPTCPRCRRPVAVLRPACLYCGAALPAEIVAAAAEARPQPRPAADEPRTAPSATADRVVLVLDLDRSAASAAIEPARLAEALGLSAYEAGRRLRLGGLQLLGVAARVEAQAAAARLTAVGLGVHALAEAEVRQAAQPVVALGGHRDGARLSLRTNEGPIEIAPGELLLVVRGPITREPQAGEVARPKLIRVAAPDPGYRLHLHRRTELRPIELDPATLGFGPEGAPGGSALAALVRWAEALAEGAPIDDRFRTLAPALSPAAKDDADATLAVSLAGARPAARPGDARAWLDNVPQFRFYSAWRAAVERKRTGL